MNRSLLSDKISKTQNLKRAEEKQTDDELDLNKIKNLLLTPTESEQVSGIVNRRKFNESMELQDQKHLNSNKPEKLKSDFT